MNRKFVSTGVTWLLAVSIVSAQRGGGDWMTSGYDAQRSSWVRADAKISVASLSKPGFELVWKVKFNNASRGLNSITPPALLDFYIGYKGFRSLAFFGGSSDRIMTLDIDLARMEWEKALVSAPAPAGTLPCPGGMTSAVTRPTTASLPTTFGGFGAGRATGARSGVGEPHEGAVTLRQAPAQRPMPAKPKPAPTPAGGAAAPNPFAPRIQWILALGSDGKLHSMYVSNGEEPMAPIPFLPANANAHGLISVDGTVYAATSGGCGGVESGVWALDLASKQVSKWIAPGGAVAGNAGPAFDPSGKLYVTAGGGELAVLEPKSLQQVGSYKTGGAEFTSSPVLFDYKGKMLAAAVAGGQIHLVDTGNLMAGAVDKSDVFSDANYETGALASWLDPAGVRWILAPGARGDKGAIATFKVVDKDGKPSFEAGWKSQDLIAPTTPAVVNGVVFALSSGEYRTKDAGVTAAQRAQKSVPAVLYALEGISGKELWNSGKSITSFVHSGGLSAGGSRVYVGGHDGTQYAFSFPIEH